MQSSECKVQRSKCKQKTLGARITSHPILSFPLRSEVEFSFENRRLRGFDGEPIAVALAANGIKVFRITEKMLRPRGFFCAVGKCSSCLMEVDGRPNVMVCMEPLRAGMRVRRQEGRGRLASAECRVQSAECKVAARKRNTEPGSEGTGH